MFVCVCVWCVCVCVSMSVSEKDIFGSSLQVLTEGRCYNKLASRNKCSFRPDEHVSALFRSNDDDFKKSRFDRGHLAAAANHFHDQNAMDDTFLFTNISPQVLHYIPSHVTVT